MSRLRVTPLLALGLAVLAPARSQAQAPGPAPGRGPTPLYAGIGSTDSRWELSVSSRIGYPEGFLRVGETGTHATHLRLHEDLGIQVSEAVETSAAFHVTPRDAVRVTGLYYFLDGGSTFHQPIFYNGDSFGPGQVHANADFYRLSLAYERQLLSGYGMVVTGSAGLTYVHLDPRLSGQGHSNREDFFRQELPVPILGFRFDVPLDARWGVRATAAGGGLPAVDSLRKEGGTVYLTQIHVDGGLALTYALSRAVLLQAGYTYTYFLQHEKSHEDDNTFELNDNGFRVGLSLAF